VAQANALGQTRTCSGVGRRFGASRNAQMTFFPVPTEWSGCGTCRPCRRGASESAPRGIAAVGTVVWLAIEYTTSNT
jgi:hypothetical protein